MLERPDGARGAEDFQQNPESEKRIGHGKSVQERKKEEDRAEGNISPLRHVRRLWSRVEKWLDETGRRAEEGFDDDEVLQRHAVANFAAAIVCDRMKNMSARGRIEFAEDSNQTADGPGT